PALVRAARTVLAVGPAGVGAVAGRLAGLAAVQAGGDHLRRAVRLPQGPALPAGPRARVAAGGPRDLRTPAWRPGTASDWNEHRHDPAARASALVVLGRDRHRAAVDAAGRGRLDHGPDARSGGAGGDVAGAAAALRGAAAVGVRALR